MILSIITVAFALLVGGNDGRLLQERIYLGEPRTLPVYEVAILMNNVGYGTRICTGALIDPQWVVTSAQCATMSRTLRVITGQLDISSYNGEQGQIITSPMIHPLYDGQRVRHNIALIKLNPPASGNITVVTLPRYLEKYDNLIATVSGYGLYDSSRQHDLLFSKNLQMKSYKDCALVYNMTIYLLCARERIICDGDQGGPLVLGNTLIGIVNAGFSSPRPMQCDNTVDSVFLNIYHYVSWIKKITKIP